MRLKLKRNNFGLRVTCTTCNQTFTSDSIKKCNHFNKQKYKVIIYLPGTGSKTKKLKTRDYDKAIEEAVKFKNQVKKGELTIVNKQKKAVVTEQNLLLLQAADNFINQKKGNVEYTFLKKDELTDDYVDTVTQYLSEFIKVLSKQYSVNQLRMCDISEEHIEAWWVDISEKYDNHSTLNARIRALRGFITHVNRRFNLILKNYFLEIELRDEINEIRAISKVEFDELCKAVDNESSYYYYTTKKGERKRKSRYRDYLLDAFHLGLYTGLRREELFSLKWSDIKRETNGKLLLVVPNLKVNRITKKEFRPKYIPVYQNLLDFLKSIGLDAKLGIDEYLICPNRKVKMNTLKDCTSRAFKHYFAKAFPDAKEILPFKSLRKTYLTYLSKYVGSDAIYLSSHASETTLERHYLDPRILTKGESMKMFS